MTEHKSLTEALVAFQAELPSVKKGNTAKVTSQKGSYSYQYADLTDITEIIMPVLTKYGLSFTSRPTMTESGFVLAYSLRHVSGEADEGEYPLPDPAHNPAQTIGSAITYARRYCLCAATGLAPGGDDDDATAAQTAAPRRDPQQATRVARAATALSGAKTLEAVEKVWADIQKSGLGESLAGAHAERVAALTPSPSATDEWAPVAEIAP